MTVCSVANPPPTDTPGSPEPGPQRAWRRLLGVVFLFSGAALLGTILGRVDLRLTLASTVVLASGALFLAWRALDPLGRRRFTAIVLMGVVVGTLATVAYDAAKAALSQLDASPYHPFEVLRVFGALLLGDGPPPAARLAAGIAFHALNGVLFGVAFNLLLGHRGVPTGIVWGLFLETFQLTLYPGWLGITQYREFAQISGFGHVVYGAVLGYGCSRWRRRLGLTRAGV